MLHNWQLYTTDHLHYDSFFTSLHSILPTRNISSSIIITVSYSHMTFLILICDMISISVLLVARRITLYLQQHAFFLYHIVYYYSDKLLLSVFTSLILSFSRSLLQSNGIASLDSTQALLSYSLHHTFSTISALRVIDFQHNRLSNTSILAVFLFRIVISSSHLLELVYPAPFNRSHPLQSFSQLDTVSFDSNRKDRTVRQHTSFSQTLKPPVRKDSPST